jgi:hypothetical protein
MRQRKYYKCPGCGFATLYSEPLRQDQGSGAMKATEEQLQEWTPKEIGEIGARAKRLAEAVRLALSDNHCTPDTDKVLREALAQWECKGAKGVRDK